MFETPAFRKQRVGAVQNTATDLPSRKILGQLLQDTDRVVVIK